MLSFYTMTPLFGLVYAALRYVRRELKPLSWTAVLVLTVPLIVDGGTHLLDDAMHGVLTPGFRDANVWLAWATGDRWPAFYAGDHFGTFNWWMRLMTGLLAAWAIAFSAFPRLDKAFQHLAATDGVD